ncbi:protein disulfide-isomerase [Parapedobacter luteus]|uniref:Protein disulfide-isomerase n=1 Tax=Parapedobacter luteus TaxID=623280 RepID=A0A1T5AXB5_9SPHI|nr:DsbA family oxidoreductase [Parapedobacter luteus]SKB39616.1 protein disulfide-isomerase [Parapedobacter luteus]
MKIEVWSDIACPFCYIGKHHFETALARFSGRQAVRLEWKSFQLDPDLPKDTIYTDTYHYLAERKGLPIAQARDMTVRVAAMAKHAGVELNFERTVVANTWDAHRLLHMAQLRGVGNAMKEILFRAHFTEGKDISDRETLVALGESAGLEQAAITAMLNSDQYGYDVARDIQEARNIGARGVPFFVFDRKYAVSGAQPSEVFLETLEKAFETWKKENPNKPLDLAGGLTCRPDGDCD